MNVFPMNAEGFAFGEFLTVCADQGCLSPAAITDMNGVPVPLSQISITNGVIPPFQSLAKVLYALNASGSPVALYPSPQVTAPVVTGAKGGNAALTSLVGALSGLGLIVDQTS